MAIDYEGIWDKMIEVAREPTYTPTDLSISDSGLKSAIRYRQGHPQEDYPYVVVDILDTVQENGWLFDRYLDTNEDLVYATNYKVLIEYRCYSDKNGTARQVVNQLIDYFRYEQVRSSLFTDIGVTIEQTSPIDVIPVDLSTKEAESASFTITLNLVDEAAYDEGIIGVIGLEGDLIHAGYDDPNDPNAENPDPDPLPVTANIDITP